MQLSFVALFLGPHAPQKTIVVPDVSAQIEAGRRDLAAGNGEAAMARFRDVLRLDPGNAVANNILGSYLNQTGRYGEALPYAEAAVTADPANMRYRYNRGVVLAEHGRFGEALADFDAALAAHPDMAYAWLERGATLASLGRQGEARQSWVKARGVAPSLIWVEWYDATGDLIEGRYAEAAAAFGRVAQVQPDFLAAQLWQHFALSKAGKPIAVPMVASKDWPAPILAFARGAIGAEELLAEAARDRTSGDDRRIGEALFFIAASERASGRSEEAASLLRRAIATRSPRHLWKLLAEAALLQSHGK